MKSVLRINNNTDMGVAPNRNYFETGKIKKYSRFTIYSCSKENSFVPIYRAKNVTDQEFYNTSF